MLSIKYLCRLASHTLRSNRDCFTKYKWSDWEFSEFQGEKFFSLNFGQSKEKVRLTVDYSLPEGWTKADEQRFAQVLSAMALS